MSNYFYFDYAATTPVDLDVKNHYFDALENKWFNLSSAHKNELLLEFDNIKNSLASLFFPGSQANIIFTSGATESINTIIKSFAISNKNKKILTTAIEHKATLDTLDFCKNFLKIDYEFIKTDKFGIIDIDDLKNKLTENVGLVTFLAVHNELGSIQPIKKAYQIVKEFDENILFHVDGAQLIGKSNIQDFIGFFDAISLSGHKFYAPKGIGMLGIKKNFKLLPLINGGRQQNNLRSGTINFPLISTFHFALNKILNNFEENFSKVKELNKYFLMQLETLNNKFSLNSDAKNSTPFIINCSILGTKGEIIKNFLGDRKIYISTGSACSQNAKKNSILYKLNYKKDIAESSIRISLSHLTTKEEIDFLFENLEKSLELFIF